MRWSSSLLSSMSASHWYSYETYEVMMFMLRGIHKLWRERERQGVREEEGGGFSEEAVLEVAVIVLMGKLIEPLWGTLEMVVFFAIINIGVALIKLSYQDNFPLSPFPGGFYLSVCPLHSTDLVILLLHPLHDHLQH